jgi:Holliday junction resolvase RusA-like endonuclease
MIVVALRGEPEGRRRHRSRMVFPKDLKKKPFIHEYPDPAGVAYETALALAAKVAMAGKRLLEGPIAIKVTAVMGVPTSWSNAKRDRALSGVLRPTTKPDFDNILKQVDAFKSIVWRDDALVVEASIIKAYGEEPELIVEIKPLDPFVEEYGAKEATQIRGGATSAG